MRKPLLSRESMQDVSESASVLRTRKKNKCPGRNASALAPKLTHTFPVLGPSCAEYFIRAADYGCETRSRNSNPSKKLLGNSRSDYIGMTRLTNRLPTTFLHRPPSSKSSAVHYKIKHIKSKTQKLKLKKKKVAFSKKAGYLNEAGFPHSVYRKGKHRGSMDEASLSPVDSKSKAKELTAKLLIPPPSRKNLVRPAVLTGGKARHQTVFCTGLPPYRSLGTTTPGKQNAIAVQRPWVNRSGAKAIEWDGVGYLAVGFLGPPVGLGRVVRCRQILGGQPLAGQNVHRRLTPWSFPVSRELKDFMANAGWDFRTGWLMIL